MANMTFRTKIKQFIQNLTTTVQRLSINYQQPGIPALCTSPGAVPQSRKSPESILADIFEPILYAVPRNRKTYEKSLTRRMSLPEMANARPKKNIIICLDCGNPHERQTICGHCYSKVRDETGRMMEAMGEDKFNFDHPRQEVAYLYKGENAEDIPMYKGKYLVEMDTERPSWFTQDLLKKVKGDT